MTNVENNKNLEENGLEKLARKLARSPKSHIETIKGLLALGKSLDNDVEVKTKGDRND